MDIYGISGVVTQNIHQGQNTSVPVYSTDFDFAAVEAISQRLAGTQGFVEASNVVTNTIMLRLPLPDCTGPEDVMEVIARFNFLGPADPADSASTLLGMFGMIDGVPPAPGDPVRVFGILEVL